MKIRIAVSIGAMALAGLWVAGTAWGQAGTHLGHVKDSWNDTPGKVGLVTILEDEAKTAAAHAGFANPCNLGAMKTHTPHVRQAIDASTESGGPGKGYGVAKAAMGVAAHMDFARKSGDASDSLKLHSEHIISAANNIVAWSAEIISLSDKVQGAMDKSRAAGAMKDIQARTQWIVNGNDANGDGKISWQKGEGGLAQLKQHLGFIQQ